MEIFRWIIGGLALMLAAGSLLSLLVFIAFDLPHWLDRARSLRRGTYAALLLWFNVEVWGQVIGTLIRW